MRRHWYHCTTANHGEFLDVLRKVPYGSTNEPLVPRLCVGPTIASCFAARLFDSHRHVRVYRTVKPCNGIRPRQVWDADITGERWLIPPCRLQHVLSVPASVVTRVQNLVLTYHRVTRKTASVRIRIAQFAIVAQLLGSPRDAALGQQFLAKCGISDPAAYLRDLITQGVAAV